MENIILLRGNTYLQAKTEASLPCPFVDPTAPSTVQFDWSPGVQKQNTQQNINRENNILYMWAG